MNHECAFVLIGHIDDLDEPTGSCGTPHQEPAVSAGLRIGIRRTVDDLFRFLWRDAVKHDLVDIPSNPSVQH